MTDFKVGDRCEITKDFPSRTGHPGWTAGTPVTLAASSDSKRFHVVSDSGRTDIVHIDHLRSVSSPESKHLACPHCGMTDSFYEVNRSINCSDIDYVDAETGKIEWGGSTEYGDPTEILRYECGNCDNEIEDWYFDPDKRAAHDAERIKSAQEDLDRILSS